MASSRVMRVCMVRMEGGGGGRKAVSGEEDVDDGDDPGRIEGRARHEARFRRDQTRFAK